MKIIGAIPSGYASACLLCVLRLSVASVLFQITMLACIVLNCGCKSSHQQVVIPESLQPKMPAALPDSPFQNYDREVVRAIQARWYELLATARRQRVYSPGSVVVQFHIFSDGRIKELQVVESNVDEIYALLCQKAVLDPSPFRRWPDEMVRMVNAPYREVRFTFWYE